MKYAFLISGENPELAKAEIEYLLSLSNPEVFGRVLIYESQSLMNVNRLALTKEVVEVHSICNFGELENVVKELSGSLLSSFKSYKICIRVKYFSPGSLSCGLSSCNYNVSKKLKNFDLILSGRDCSNLERNLGKILYSRGFKISVSSPEIIVRIYIFPDSTAVVGILKFKQDTKQYTLRHPKKRPFFKPGVMLPKFCRAIVNISTVNGTFLDPMCGTGGFVIEAFLVGLKAVGIEVYPEVARGCRQNLNFLSPYAHVVCGDATNLPIKSNSIDGVATDFPYFLSSKSIFDRETLHSRVAEEVCRVLKHGKRAVLVTNVDVSLAPLKVIEIYNIRIHSSLTRKIYILEKN